MCDLSVFTCCQLKCINHGHLDFFYFLKRQIFICVDLNDFLISTCLNFQKKKYIFFQFGFLPSNFTSCGTTFSHSVSVAISNVSKVPEIKISI
jgi:hypothetical protein